MTGWRGESTRATFFRSLGEISFSINTAMHRFLVDVEVGSTKLTDAQITSVIGARPTFVAAKGEKRPVGRASSSTVWRLESTAPKDAELDRHMEDVFSRWPADAAARLKKLDAECSVRLRVAALHETYTCSATIHARWLERLGRAGLHLEISAYPSAE